MTRAELVQQRSMLVILIAACRTAQTAFEAADNVVDQELLADLTRMIERSEHELSKLAEKIAAEPRTSPERSESVALDRSGS